jgi:hypothetical protein
MKKTLLVFLSLLLLAVPAALHAQDYDYVTNSDGVTVTITDYLGSGGNVIIPGTIAGLPVTSIGDRTFEEIADLTSVTIPVGVTNIGSWVFFSCNNLTNITIPEGVTSIGASAFDNCTSLPNITIPEGVTSIGDWTFDFCTSLVSITIPAGITSVGDWAFSDCISLTNITLAEGVTNIGVGAFFECGSLVSANIPEGVASIGVNAFYNCASLASVSIPGSVTSIQFQTFESCISLTNVVMANGVAAIDEGAFDYCTSLASATIPATVTNIGVEAFQSCGCLTSLVIPASVTSISNNAFSFCTRLANIYFEGDAPTPGKSVFLYDTNAKAYYLPDTTGWKPTYAGIPAALLPTYIVKLAFSPPRSGATVGGGGHFLRGSNITVTASTTNDCYQFVDWTAGLKKVSTNSEFSLTVTNSETLVANFALFEYAISTSSSPNNWGTTGGGGKKGCGATVILTATPRPGFAFTEWTSSLGATITNSHYKFEVGGSESFVANFIDVRKPTVRIAAPVLNQRIGTAAFTIKGTASDNAAVAAVYYNLNDAGWQIASSSNGFKSWFADVSLTPDSANSLSAYAEDTSGNLSPTNGPITFTCTAQGLAPASIAGDLAEVITADNAIEYLPVSFDSASYVAMPANANNAGEIGSYTYTPTSPNTAELTQRRALPITDNAVNGSVLELTFTDAYTATFTNLAGASGTFSFAPTEESVPKNLDGTVAVTTSFETNNAFSTNSFGHSTFTTTDTLGRCSSGTYTFTKFTPVGALITETYTSPSEKVGTTNYVIMTFKEGASRSEGVYYSENRDASGKLDSDIGNFH